MSLSTTALSPQVTDPVSDAPTPWLFPMALNKTFVSEFTARLPASSRFRGWGNGTTSEYPPSPFGSHGSRPDIILDSIYGLTFHQRLAIPSDGSPTNHFGRINTSVRVGDTIALDWVGGERKVVAMTCHECFQFDIKTQDASQGCERFKSDYGELMSFHNGALSTNEEYMKTQFSDPYGYTDWDLPQPQISPNTIITIPKLASGSSGSVCMFTLDWNQWSLNTQHSVPFAVIAEQRLAGRNENRNPIYDVWAFNSTHPLGVSISGIKPKVDDFNAGGGNTGGNTGSNRTSAVIWKRPGDEKSDPPIGTIAASIVGGIASFLILAVILVKLRRRGRSQVVEESAVETASRQDTGHVVPLQSETSSTKGVPPPTYEEAIKR